MVTGFCGWCLYIHTICVCVYIHMHDDSMCACINISPSHSCWTSVCVVWSTMSMHVYRSVIVYVYYTTENKCCVFIHEILHAETDSMGQSETKWKRVCSTLHYDYSRAYVCVCVCAVYVLVLVCITYRMMMCIARCDKHIVNILRLPCEQNQHNTHFQAYAQC